MPISRTVNGLRYEFPHDSLDESANPFYAPIEKWSIDTEEKKEGSGSLKFSTDDFSFSAYAMLGRLGAIQPGDRVHIWHKSATANHTWQLKVSCIGQASCAQGSIPYYTTLVIQKTGIESWTLKKADIPSNIAVGENQWIYPSVIVASNYVAVTDYVDHLVISSTRYLTVTGLSPGQKVELYRGSDDTKIDEETCAGGQSSVVLDVDAEDYPEYMYLKVYATDGVTLVEKTAKYRMCGGDTWHWVCPLGTMAMKSVSYTIYRTGSAGSPTSTDMTATLRTPAGAPYPNATVYFSATKGSVSPTSDVTDANGEAHTTLSSDVHGVAVVKAYWLGDASVPAAVAYATHHVLYDAETPDADKKFQLFIEGIEYSYSNGRYALSNESTPQEFTVEIPEWVDTITRRGIVSIYRKGVKEFSGILTVIDRDLAVPPRVLLGGVSGNALLDTRVVTIKDYSAQTIEYMVDDILDSFWCGISLGTVGSYPDTLTQTFADETVGSSVSRLCDIIGWKYRVNTSLQLDVKPEFGMSKPTIEFVQGQNLFINRYRIDDREVTNSLRMRGSEDLVSTVFDGYSIENENLGLLEDVTFQKSIGVQATLDIAGAAELARRAGKNLAVQAEVLDQYDAGTWGVDDSVTLTVPKHGLSDEYKVVRIQRDMTDPNWASVDFITKLSLEWTDLWGRLRRELKDLSAKTTI